MKIYSNKIPKEFKILEQIFHRKANIRLVGGAVRDLISGDTPHDLDFSIDIPPEKVMAIATEQDIRCIPTGIPHGTVTLVIDNKKIEITTLRIDVKSIDGRHAEIAFTDDWKADAARRDFTINALSMDNNGNVYDYFNGIKDLQDKIIRFVGNPEDRIREDGLRILRYFRFVSRLYETSIPEYNSDAINAIEKNINCIDNISRERISNELHKIIDTKNAFVWNIMKDVSLLNRLDIPDGNSFYHSKFSKLLNYPKNNFELIIAYMCMDKHFIKNVRKKISFTRNENKLLDFLVEHSKIKLNEDEIIKLIYKDNKRKDYIELLSIVNFCPQEITDMIINETYHKLPIEKTEVSQHFVNKRITTLVFNKLINKFIQSKYTLTREAINEHLEYYRRTYDIRSEDRSINQIVN